LKKIIGFYHVNNTEVKQFDEHFSKAMNLLQDDKQEVEVQYKTNVFDNGQILYSALLIGRKYEEDRINE